MTEILEIKADKKLFHHYIVCVVMKGGVGEDSGTYKLKYKVIHFTHNSIENLRDAIMLKNDEVFKTTESEAMKIFDCEELVSTLHSLRLACKVNHATMHHFSSEYEIDEDWFETIVENAHKIQSYKKLLQESLMK